MNREDSAYPFDPIFVLSITYKCCTFFESSDKTCSYMNNVKYPCHISEDKTNRA